jgi:hypothetical protein
MGDADAAIILAPLLRYTVQASAGGHSMSANVRLVAQTHQIVMIESLIIGGASHCQQLSQFR